MHTPSLHSSHTHTEFSQLNSSEQHESYLSTQHMSSRCCGTCAGLRRAGQSERRQARKALVLLERSSLARPNHNRRRLGQVHSRKHRAGTSSGVRADLALPLLHSLTITGGTATETREARCCENVRGDFDVLFRDNHTYNSNKDGSVTFRYRTQNALQHLNGTQPSLLILFTPGFGKSKYCLR